MGRLFGVMVKARVEPFTTKSDMARVCANEIALLASEGLLTAPLDMDRRGHLWYHQINLRGASPKGTPQPWDCVATKTRQGSVCYFSTFYPFSNFKPLGKVWLQRPE